MSDTIADSIRTVVNSVTDSLQSVVALSAKDTTIIGNDNCSFMTWLEQHEVLVSVIIFVIGWILTVIITKISEWVKRKVFKHVVLDWIEIIAPMEKHLSQSLRQLSKEMESTDEMLPLRYEMPPYRSKQNKGYVCGADDGLFYERMVL